MFSPETYEKRRNLLKEQLQSGIALFLGNEDTPMNYTDNQYPFRQDSSFLYFFGLDYPGLAGLIDIDENREIVFGDEISLDDIIWMGPQPPLTEKCQAAGITETAGFNKLENYLEKVSSQKRKIHFLNQYRPENILTIQRLLKISPSEIRDHVSIPLTRSVIGQRALKSPGEIAEIEAALDISFEMQTQAMKRSRPGIYEREIAGFMEGLTIAMGGRTSFPTIFSIHGETLHNHHHGNMMKEGDIVINDSGAESSMHYAADITRTFPVSGRFTERQKSIYTIVLKAQEEAINAVKPGVEFRQIHILACELLASGLKDLGLMKGDIKEAVRAGAHAMFFQCGLGHMMGLDVHDMEGLGEDLVGYTETIKRSPQFGLRYLRLGRKLEPGFVITVEPGLYFIPELIDRWKAEDKNSRFINYDAVEKYRAFGGMRVEDDVLVTENGCRVLGKKIPRTITEVEDTCSS